MTAGAGDENAPGCGHLRAADADRERVVDLLKVAFAQGWLTKDSFDARVSRALASRTYADLAGVIAGVPAGPAAAPPRRADPVVPGAPAVPAMQRARSRPVARAALGSWWLRFLAAGLVLAVLGATLLIGAARAETSCLGVMIFLQAAARGLVDLSRDRGRGCVHPPARAGWRARQVEAISEASAPWDPGRWPRRSRPLRPVHAAHRRAGVPHG